MAEILVVEDDAAIAELITIYLQRDQHQVHHAGNGLDALSRLSVDPVPFDLVILDLMLPGLDGRGVCRRLREHSNVPVIMLTALDDDRDLLEGFGLGADDYLTKPFKPAELLARTKAILRRSNTDDSGSVASGLLLAFGNLILNPDARTVQVAGQELSLRSREFDLLETLLLNQGVVLSRDRLYALVWTGEHPEDSRTVDVHISRLRDRLARADASVEIVTVRSVGYRLSAR